MEAFSAIPKFPFGGRIAFMALCSVGNITWQLLSFHVEPNKVPKHFSTSSALTFSMSADCHTGGGTERSTDLNRWYQNCTSVDPAENKLQWLIDFPGEAALQARTNRAFKASGDQPFRCVQVRSLYNSLSHLFSKPISDQKNKQTLCMQIQKVSKSSFAHVNTPNSLNISRMKQEVAGVCICFSPFKHLAITELSQTKFIKGDYRRLSLTQDFHLGGQPQ